MLSVTPIVASEPNFEIYNELERRTLRAFFEPLGMGEKLTWIEYREHYGLAELPHAGAELLGGDHAEAYLVGYRWEGGYLPLSILFLRLKPDVKFGVISLVAPSLLSNPKLKTEIEEKVMKFFNENAEDLFHTVGWEKFEVTGMLDRPLYWREKPDQTFVSKWLLENNRPTSFLPVLPTVYPYNNPYSLELLEQIERYAKKGMKTLVLGCGSGLDASLLSLRTQTQVDAIDINPLAIANTRLIAELLGTSDRVKTWVSNGFEKISGRYDLIVFDAPLAVTENRPDDLNRFDHGGKLLKSVLGDLPKYFADASSRMYLMSRPEIDSYMPSALKSEILKAFTAGTNLGIHQIMLRPS